MAGVPMKVVMSDVTVPNLVRMGNLVGVGWAIETAFSAGNVLFGGLSVEGRGRLDPGSFVFDSTTTVSVLMGKRTHLELPYSGILSLRRGRSFLGGHWFTLSTGAGEIEMLTMYGHSDFVDDFATRI